MALPSPDQLAWQDLEVGTFFHLQPDANPTPASITYANFNADAWADAAAAEGARYVIMVAKHRSGFCWWSTTTTDYGIKSAPYKAGKGDIVAELFAACRARGLKVGFYLSPEDIHFGIGIGGNTPDTALQTRYAAIFTQQMKELCSNYGDISEIWFDGGLLPRIMDSVRTIIKTKQPHAILFQGPDATIRWVGNENGVAPYPAWNATDNNGGTGTVADSKPDGKYWLPMECDASISNAWFGGVVENLNTLVDRYFRSVGNGQTLLNSFSPSPDGHLDLSYVSRAAEFGAEIKKRIGFPLAQTSGEGINLVLDLGKPVAIDHVIMMEDIAFGERVREYTLEGMVGGSWTPLASGTAIGHKRIHALTPVTVSQVRINFTKYAAVPKIRNLYVTKTGVAVIDSTPPSVPLGLTGIASGNDKVQLTWSASADSQSGIQNYVIYRNGAIAGKSSTTSFLDMGLSESTSYSYQVSAINGLGAESGKSATLVVLTSADTTRPNIVGAAIKGDTIFVTFTEKVEKTSAENVANYHLSNNALIGPAKLLSDSVTVGLIIPTFPGSESLTLSVSQIRDRAKTANSILPNTTVPVLYGLAKFWKFDEGTGSTILDKVSGKTTPILGNAAWTDGKINKALLFDGTSTYVDVADLPSASDFTISTWIKPATAKMQMICAKEQAGHAPYQWRLYLTASTHLGYETSDDGALDFGLYPFESPSPIVLNQWTHIALVRNVSTLSYELFINGQSVLQKTPTAFINQPYNLSHMLIGGRYASDGTSVMASELFSGAMDEFRSYSRCLSGAEIAALAIEQPLLVPSQRLGLQMQEHVRYFNNRLTIPSSMAADGPWDISIVDSQGKRVLRDRVQRGQFVLDVTLPTGAYWIELRSQSQSVPKTEIITILK